jgi:hypothetical protein
MTDPAVICKVLDQLDSIITRLVGKYGLDAEDIETVLQTLLEKFRS